MGNSDKYNPNEDFYRDFDIEIILGSLIKSNLDFIGTKQFYVIDKFQLYSNNMFNIGRCYFYIKDEDGEIKYPLLVTEEEYKKYDIGSQFKEMGLVKLNKQDIILPTRATNVQDAKKEIMFTTYKELFEVFILIIILILTIYFKLK
ncbi:hypothetical protein [Thermobrachium celere]|uniref:Uncharacterized protein n=1 Tax=Thermobrachium celere DSM 8682 TaxID=941824 RepID=R7RTQ3_9CLOT|nr:hypothetical protein [Thermobrachium celere]CDF58620.1 hypothetical protein TCEL_00666 [Thermobrachium celere DSM 8682]